MSKDLTTGGNLLTSLRGIFSLLAYAVNTLFWSIPIFSLAVFKRAFPRGRWRAGCDRLQNAMAELWIAANIVNQQVSSRSRWDVHLPGDLQRHGWYLVIANHRSWVDILVLQRIFHRRIPFLKFFLKKELFWIPVLGQAWWALDFPFMKRHPKSYLKRHPERLGQDLDITRRACEKFKAVPISVMSFVEGTRYSEKKRLHQKSPYRNLLRARAGGIAYVLSAMEGQIDRILNVTIAYPQKNICFWDYVCGRISDIRVNVDSIAVADALIGDYARDRNFRRRFQKWLNSLWAEKDACYQRLLDAAECDALSNPAPAGNPARASAGLP